MRLFTISILAIAFMISCTSSPHSSEPENGIDYPVAILSEVLSSNSSTIADEYGDYDDYIEIRNPGDTLIDISGFGLSDDVAEIVYLLPEPTMLMPDSTILIWCDNEPEQGDFHADFRISSLGEWLGLFDESGNVIDSVTVPELAEDMAYHRDDSLGWFTATPAPGE